MTYMRTIFGLLMGNKRECGPKQNEDAKYAINMSRFKPEDYPFYISHKLYCSKPEKTKKELLDRIMQEYGLDPKLQVALKHTSSISNLVFDGKDEIGWKKSEIRSEDTIEIFLGKGCTDESYLQKIAYRISEPLANILINTPGYENKKGYDLSGYIRRSAMVNNPAGIHARPSALIAKGCLRYEGEALFESCKGIYNGKEIMDVLMSGLPRGSVVNFHFEPIENHAAFIESAFEMINKALNEKL